MDQSPQSAMSDLMWRLSSVETKVKLNEQNFFNLQERVQLFSQNFLDLKTELRNRADNLTEELHDLEKKVDSLGTKYAQSPKAADVEEIKKFHKAINVFSPDMSKDDAKKILDDVMRKLEK